MKKLRAPGAGSQFVQGVRKVHMFVRGFPSSAARSGIASNSSKQSSTEPSAPDKRSFMRPGLILSSTRQPGDLAATCAAAVQKPGGVVSIRRRAYRKTSR